MSVLYLQDMVRRTPLPLSQAKKRALRRHRLVACRQTLLDLAEEQARLYGASQCWFGPPSDVDFLHASKREIDFAPLPQDNIYRTASLNNNKHIDSHSLIDVDISHNAVASESSRPVHNAVAAVASESSHNAVASESSQNAVASESSRPVQNAVASESSHHAVASESPHNAVSQVVSTSKVTCASSHDVIPSSSSKEASMSKDVIEVQPLRESQPGATDVIEVQDGGLPDAASQIGIPSNQVAGSSSNQVAGTPSFPYSDAKVVTARFRRKQVAPVVSVENAGAAVPITDAGLLAGVSSHQGGCGTPSNQVPVAFVGCPSNQVAGSSGVHERELHRICYGPRMEVTNNLLPSTEDILQRSSEARRAGDKGLMLQLLELSRAVRIPSCSYCFTRYCSCSYPSIDDYLLAFRTT